MCSPSVPNSTIRPVIIRMRKAQAETGMRGVCTSLACFSWISPPPQRMAPRTDARRNEIPASRNATPTKMIAGRSTFSVSRSARSPAEVTGNVSEARSAWKMPAMNVPAMTITPMTTIGSHM